MVLRCKCGSRRHDVHTSHHPKERLALVPQPEPVAEPEVEPDMEPEVEPNMEPNMEPEGEPEPELSAGSIALLREEEAEILSELATLDANAQRSAQLALELELASTLALRGDKRGREIYSLQHILLDPHSVQFPFTDLLTKVAARRSQDPQRRDAGEAAWVFEPSTFKQVVALAAEHTQQDQALLQERTSTDDMAEGDTDASAVLTGSTVFASDTAEEIDLVVRELTGNAHRIKVRLSDTVGALKHKIHTDGHAAIEPDRQRLMLNKSSLDDETLSLGACGVRRGSELLLALQDPAAAAARRLARATAMRP